MALIYNVSTGLLLGWYLVSAVLYHWLSLHVADSSILFNRMFLSSVYSKGQWCF